MGDSMIYVACDDCRLRGRCRTFSLQHRLSVLAWANDLPAPDCLQHQPRWHRGIEGVIDCALPPAPSQGTRQNTNYHQGGVSHEH